MKTTILSKRILQSQEQTKQAHSYSLDLIVHLVLATAEMLAMLTLKQDQQVAQQLLESPQDMDKQ